MTAAAGRRRPVDADAAAVLGTLAIIVAASAFAVTSPVWTDGRDRVIVASFFAVMVVGALWRLSIPRWTQTAPITTAAGYAFAMTTNSPLGHVVDVSASVVVAVTGAALVVGGAINHWRAMPVGFVAEVARLLGVATVAVLYRVVPLWDNATIAEADLESATRWPVAVVMVLVSAVGLLVDATCTGILRALRDGTPVRQRVLDAYRAMMGMSLAMSATGTLIALAERALGVVAIPLFVIPLLLTQFAVRRAQGIAETHLQTIRMLSRLTERGQYTTADHAARVARLAVAIGHDLGLPERQCDNLEYAALLHDIGQLALLDAIPDGATSLAAPVDQTRIAADSARIVIESGVPEEVATIVAAQATQFRQVREFGEQLPLESRILKVANAFDDFVGPGGMPGRADAAIERICLGLGYEYDPRVVDALVRVLARRS